MTKNQIDYQALLESKRHNEAYEFEMATHDRAVEQANMLQAGASQAQAAAANLNAQSNALNAQTNARAQDLAELKWNDPLGGGEVSETLKNMSGFGKILGGIWKGIGTVSHFFGDD